MVDGGKLLDKLKVENATLISQQEQQRISFDKRLDDVANHVLQSLISQKVNFNLIKFHFNSSNNNNSCSKHPLF